MIRQFWQAWDRFWFSPIDTFKLSLMRLLLGCLMLWMYSIRALAFKIFYTDEGMVTHNVAPELMHEFYRPLIYLGNNTMTGPLYVALMVFILLLILGVGGRLTSFILLMLHLSFVQRNFSVVYGVELVVGCWLFYLSIARNNRYLSLENWWRPEPVTPQPEPRAELASAVGWRLMQMQMCAVYGYTGIEKLKGGPWWEGSAIWSVLGNPQLMLADFSFLQHLPTLVALATFASVLFEIYFPILVWIRPIRKWLLLFGILFHLQIAMTMGLLAFGCAMVLGYLPFLDDGWVRAQFLRWTAWVPRPGPVRS